MKSGVLSWRLIPVRYPFDLFVCTTRCWGSSLINLSTPRIWIDLSDSRWAVCWASSTNFTRLSKLLGYGSVNDVAVESTQRLKTLSIVTLYTANVCPFCPIVKKRLIELQRDLEFKLKEIDITFRPSLIKEKSFRSVPVIELDGNYWVGNATSAQIFSFILKHN